jgi:NAD(P)H-nitrite reductase large subunit
MSRKDLEQQGAVVQRDGETYAVVPRLPCGLITDLGVLRRIVDTAERHHAQALKITSAQRIAIIGLREEELEAVWRELELQPGYAIGLCVRSIKACPGTTYCRLGQQDAMAMGTTIEQRFLGRQLPNKLKIAVSGCPLCCAESRVRDVGLVGSRKGWEVVVGGSAAGRPRVADTWAENLTTEAALAEVERILDGYARLGKKKRIGELIEQLGGLEAFRQILAAALHDGV